MTAGRKEFIKLLEELSRSRHIWQTWQDFSEMSSLALRLPFEKSIHERAKALYARYEQPELIKLDRMFTIVTEELEAQYQDFLGSVFMELELGNSWKGQFFTPYNICRMMAEMQLSDVEKYIDQRGFFTVNDPCVGGGAMLIAVADVIRRKDLNHSQCIYFEAQDVDSTAIHMAHIQLSLCGLAGKMIIGDTLRMKISEAFYTPVYHLNKWSLRLALDTLRGRREQKIVEKPPPGPEPDKPFELDFLADSESELKQEPTQLVFNF